MILIMPTALKLRHRNSENSSAHTWIPPFSSIRTLDLLLPVAQFSVCLEFESIFLEHLVVETGRLPTAGETDSEIF